MTTLIDGRPGEGLASIVRSAAWDASLEPCHFDDIQRMQTSVDLLAHKLANADSVYGITHGFGPLVAFSAADSPMEQGAGLIAHLGTAQGRPLEPEVCRLIVWLRLSSMRQGYSAVAPDFWQTLVDLWNAGFTPSIPRDGTVSASGDLQPLAHAAMAHAGTGEAWVRGDNGWAIQPAAQALAAMGAKPVDWSAREALAFVNGTSVSLAVCITNHQAVLRLVRGVGLLTARIVDLLGSNREAYHAGIGRARGQVGQLTVAEWIRQSSIPAEGVRNPLRPLQEPYSLRCAPQVLGAVLDQLHATEEILFREATGCTDNPIVYAGELLHGGNFHAMPVGLCSDQIGLCLQQVAFLAERQLALLCDSAYNGGEPPMLTPRPGAGSGLAGVQLSATSFVSRIRQLAYPASLTALPTNGGNQDHVPMALNGANSVADAVELAWLVVGSLAVGVSQRSALAGCNDTATGVWAELARVSPPLTADRPLAAEVRAARNLLELAAEELLSVQS